MSKESYLNELSDKLHISKKMLEKYIYIVGTNEENIKDYSLNSGCAIARKDNGFNISYTAKMLNEKYQRIAELEEQLKNAIVPKFKMYDTVYTLNRDRADCIESGKITQINFDGVKIIYQFTLHQTKYCHTYNYKDEKDVFTTKEEALAKLEELKGEM